MSQTASKTYDEMKDSGVEWIGEVPSTWNPHVLKKLLITRIGGAWGEDAQNDNLDRICMRITDFDFARGKFKDGSPENFTKRNYTKPQIEKLALQQNDILIEKSGGGEKTPVGRSVLFNKSFDALFANFMDMLRVDSTKAVPQFFQYYWQSMYYKMVTSIYIKQTTGIQNLNLTSLLSLESFFLPSLPEQVAIAAYLDDKCSTIDDIIAEAKATIDEYKAWKASVIFETVTKGLNPNAEMKDSGVEWIGRIPSHWVISKTKYFCSKIGSGKTPKGGAEIYTDSGIMFLRSQNIYPEGLKLDNVSFISPEIDEEMSSTRVFANDVLLNITGGSIGRCCLYPEDLPHANVNQHVCIIRVLPTMILPKLMCYIWMSDIGQKSIEISQTGANREGMNFEQIGNTIIPIMNSLEQFAIVKYLDDKCATIDGVIAEKEALIAELETYKKSLIFETVTGKRRVC